MDTEKIMEKVEHFLLKTQGCYSIYEISIELRIPSKAINKACNRLLMLKKIGRRTIKNYYYYYAKNT